MAAAAPVIGAVTGGLQLATGIGSMLGSGKAQKKATSAADLQSQLAQMQMQMAQQQWNQYLQNYAPIEAQLGQYYSQSPEQLAIPMIAEGRTALDAAYGATQGNLAQLLGAYGIKGGQATGAATALESQAAKDRASMYRTGIQQALAGQQGFLQTGKGLPSAAMAGLGHSSTGQYGLMNYYQNLAGQQGQAAGGLLGQFGQALPGLLSSFGGGSATPTASQGAGLGLSPTSALNWSSYW